MDFLERKQKEKAHLKRRKMIVFQEYGKGYGLTLDRMLVSRPYLYDYFKQYWKNDYRRSGSVRVLKRMSGKAVRKRFDLPNGNYYRKVVDRWAVVD